MNITSSVLHSEAIIRNVKHNDDDDDEEEEEQEEDAAPACDGNSCKFHVCV